MYWRNSDIREEAASFAGDVGFKQEFLSYLQVQAAIGRSLRNGNLAEPQLRVYVGLKLAFPVSRVVPS